MKVSVYTDGACSNNPGPGGWGVIFSKNDGLHELSGYELETTNNRMELTAVIKAIEKILQEHKKGTNVEYELFSDSAYVVNSINNCWVENWRMNGWKTTRGEDVKNKDLWAMFLVLMSEVFVRNICIVITKVKGHSGNTFNEYVDGIAKKQVLIAIKGGKP